MSWLARFRPKTESPDTLWVKSRVRHERLSTADLFPAIEALLGDAWRSFDAAQGQPDAASVGEFGRRLATLYGAAEALEDRFRTRS
ncbi:hypothetical protein AB0G15_06030 [Streptosporangium sp. NPDC023825]|uniref:hypothetical protein n=1 Tax=Streptosporangium sp. NPDC023825 TaxID=3154909 RepID=UPI00344546E4